MRRNSSRRLRRKRRKEACLPTAGIGAPPLPPCANTQQRPVIKESESKETLLQHGPAFSGMRNLLPRQPSSSSRFLRRPPGKISTTWRWLADGGGGPTARKKRRECLFSSLCLVCGGGGGGGASPSPKTSSSGVCVHFSLSLSSLLGLTLSNRPGASSSIFAATVGPRPLLLLLLLTRQSARGNRVRQTHLVVGERERENRSFQAHTCRDRERSTPGPEFLPFLLHRKTSRITGRRRKEKKEGRRFGL